MNKKNLIIGLIFLFLSINFGIEYELHKTYLRNCNRYDYANTFQEINCDAVLIWENIIGGLIGILLGTLIIIPLVNYLTKRLIKKIQDEVNED